MADIRQNPTVKDDFNRANENPLSGGGNWLLTDHRWTNMKLVSNSITESAASPVSESYWTPETYDGDAAEIWALEIGGAVGQEGIAWSMGLWTVVGGTNAISGYRARREWSGQQYRYILRRYDNNTVHVLLDTGPVLEPGGQCWLLFRRNGLDIEFWRAPETDLSTWTLMASWTDYTYMSGFYLGLGITENSGSGNAGWDNFGGGGSTNRPQIYRWIRA